MRKLYILLVFIFNIFIIDKCFVKPENILNNNKRYINKNIRIDKPVCKYISKITNKKILRYLIKINTNKLSKYLTIINNKKLLNYLLKINNKKFIKHVSKIYKKIVINNSTDIYDKTNIIILDNYEILLFIIEMFQN